MQETKKITAGLDVKLNKSASLYHCIRIFTNLLQGGNEPNDTFKLRWKNIYETMEMAGGGRHKERSTFQSGWRPGVT